MVAVAALGLWSNLGVMWSVVGGVFLLCWDILAASNCTNSDRSLRPYLWSPRPHPCTQAKQQTQRLAWCLLFARVLYAISQPGPNVHFYMPDVHS